MSRIILAFIVALVVAACTANGVPTLANLRESLNANEDIWKKTQNYNNTYTCTKAATRYLNDNLYEFKQTYKDGDQERSNQLYANLKVGEDRQPVMVVSTKPGARGRSYILKYWNKEETCGILTFALEKNEGTGCEQHVWDTNVDSKTEDCDSEYTRICGSKKYPVYSTSCRSA